MTSQNTLDHHATLDRDSVIPLYHQLYEILRAKIDDGIWGPGDMIPPESQLKQQYGASQITIRKALDILVDGGLIYRRRGKGSFVSQRVITSNLTHIVNFAEDMRQRGLKPDTRLLSTGVSPVSKSTAQKLHVEIGHNVCVVRRLRLADGKPISVEHSCIPEPLVPGLLDNDFTTRSLSETLATDYNIYLTRAEQTIRAQTVLPEYAEYLEIAEDDPVLVIERVSYSQLDIPVEFLRITYRADRYALHNELKGSPTR